MTRPGAWRQAAMITLGALALVTGLHFVPSGPALSHLDFVPGGAGALQFCDPANPQFLAVVARASPVTVALAPESPAMAGRPVRVKLTLTTATGKPIGPADLLLTATQKILLLVAGPELGDFQTAVPTPDSLPGIWSFELTPQRAGTYRVFADLTPAATGREIYASADLPVGSAVPTEGPPAEPGGGYRFELQPSAAKIYARLGVDLRLSVRAPGGGMVPMVPDLGTFAQLTAFDRDRTGLVNVHGPSGNPAPPDPFRPVLSFHVTFPDPGRYIVWAQVSFNGRLQRVPFAIEVLP